MHTPLRAFTPQTNFFASLFLVIFFVGMGSVSYGQIISENFQSWTVRNAYSTTPATQAGSGGTWSYVNTIVAPNGLASGTGSAGYVQLHGIDGIVTLPVVATGGIGTLTFQARVSVATGAGFEIDKSINGGAWSVVQVFSSGASTTASQFQAAVNDASANIQLRINNSGSAGRTLYVHDVTATAAGTAYTITSSAGSGGTISPNGSTSVATGGSQTYTITPNLGFGISTVLVDGTNNTTAVSNGTYTFTNVTASHTISATFYAVPVLTTSKTSLTGFAYVFANGPSAAQTFTVSGTNLTAGGGTITITPSNSNYQVSSDGTNYSSSAFLTYTGTGTFSPNTVYVRLASGLALGTYTGTVNLSGGGASASVSVSGAVTPANDLCANAILFTTGAAAVSGSTAGATATSPFTSADVWYTVTPTVSGTLQVTVNTSEQDLTVTPYVNGCPAAESSNLPYSTSNQTSLTTESITFSATAGTTYTIRVNYAATTGSNVGSFTIQAALVPSPVVTSDAVTIFIGVPVSYQVQATNNPTSFSASSLPPGLSINSSGIIAGTPSTAASTTTPYASSVTATNAGGSGSGTITFTVSKQSQTITFGALAQKTTSDTLYKAGGVASSGLKVSYTSSNTSVATISNDTIQIRGAGSTVITASQAGDATYSAAASVQQTLTIVQGTDLIAGWDFQTTTNGGTKVVGATTVTQNLFVANVGAGNLYLNGSNGSSTWMATTNVNTTELNGFTGTANNAVASFSTYPGADGNAAALALVGGQAGGINQSANGKKLVFKIDMSTHKNLVVSYASQRTTTGFTSQAWEYSTDGNTWIAAQTISSLPDNFGTITLNQITGLNFISTAYLRLTVNGASANNGNNRLDNIRLNATSGIAPTITSQPVNAPSICQGTGATSTFTVTASGDATPTYQWQYSADSISFTNVATNTPAGFTYTNTTTASLSVQTAATAASGVYYYRAVVTNTLGSATSKGAKLTINPTPTAIISGPSSVCFGSGSGVNISSSTGGTVYYHLSTNATEQNVVLAAGTGANLTDVVTQQTIYTLDSVRIPGACLTLLSSSVTVNVTPLPIAGAISGSMNVGVGKNIKLTESVTGGTWSVTNGKATINSATANPVTVHGVAIGIDTVYYSVTGNGCSNSIMQAVNVYDAANFLYVTKADGNFTSPSIWKVSSDNGATFTDALDAPNDSDNIQIKHNVTLDSNYNGIATASLLINSHLSGTDTVRGTLTILPKRYLSSAGIVNFNNRHVTIKSDGTGSGAIGKITNGTIAGADSVTVERYTQKKRAWRLITSPITSATINAGWQEGNLWDGTTTNAATGYGTLITGYGQGTAANANSHGYDFWPAVANTTSSIRYYVPSSGGSWGNSLPTISNVKIRDYPAYMLFVRGDRSVSAINDTSATNLRATGTLQQGTATIGNVQGGNLREVAGNPYASAIDFFAVRNLNATRIQDKFAVWASGLGTYGAYTFVSGDGNGNYTATPLSIDGSTGTAVASTASRYIQSGEGFLVYPVSNASGNITVDETVKAPAQQATALTTTFKLSPATDRKLYVNLNQKTSDTSANLADGFLVRFDPTYTSDIDDDDATKPANFNENLGILSHNTDLIVEARADVQKTDTLHMKLWNVTKRDYQLQLKGDNWTSAPGVQAYLVDNYLASKQAVSLTGSVSSVNFTVNSDSASWQSDRFSIVFQNDAVLPLTLTSVKAAAQNGGVNVTWTVRGEQNIKGYTVERSVDGSSSYTAIGSQQAAKNAAGAAAITNYQSFDVAPHAGDNLYRIRVETQQGVVTYSSVVKVTIGEGSGRMLITLYPNPVRPNGRVSLQMSNLPAGSYRVSVYSGAGQTVYQQKITIGQANTTQSETLHLGSTLAQGSYEVRLSSHTGTILFTNQLVIGR